MARLKLGTDFHFNLRRKNLIKIQRIFYLKIFFQTENLTF